MQRRPKPETPHAGLIFRPGRPEEWQEILDVSHAGFGYKDPWFQVNVPPAYRGPDAAPEFAVCESQGRIVGLINQTPMALCLDGCRLRAVGLGGVCTLAEFRGRGAMSGLLRMSNAWQRAAGTHLGLLWGDRLRYGRYGYEIAGAQRGAGLGERNLRTVTPQPCRRVGRGETAAIARLSRASGSSVMRSTAWQALVLRRQGLEVYGNREGPLRACFAVHGGDRKRILETAGPLPLSLGILKTWMIRRKLPWLDVPLWPGNAVSRYAARHGHVGAAGVAAQVAIFDFERFLRAVAPALARNFRAFRLPPRVRIAHRGDAARYELAVRGQSLTITPLPAKGPADLALDHAQWIRTFFPLPGFAPGEGVANPWFASAFQLPLVIPVLDHV